MTELEFQQMRERVERNRNRGTADSCMRCGRPMPANSECPHCWPKALKKASSEDREATLHDRVEAECRRMGWYVVHSRLDRPTTTAIGVPDFVIALPNGRTLWLECKAKGGKLTIAQGAAQAWLRKLGHTAETVWTFERFLEIVGRNEK